MDHGVYVAASGFLRAPQARGENGKAFEVSEEKIRQSVVHFLKKSHPWRDGRVPLGAVTDLNWVVGRRLKRAVRMGAILKKGMVDMPPLVKRGDVVNLVIETGRLKITALGRVEQRGGKGDTVRVVNLDSKRRIYGKVVDRRTIQVRYRGAFCMGRAVGHRVTGCLLGVKGFGDLDAAWREYSGDRQGSQRHWRLTQGSHRYFPSLKGGKGPQGGTEDYVRR